MANADPRPNRRAWLLGLGSNLLGGVSILKADELDPIRAIAAKAKLGPFTVSTSKRFRAIGDAPASYQIEALAAAESIATEFLAHFAEKGFKDLALPKSSMTIVVLSGPSAYARFTGEPEEDAFGGHYDVGPNRLVVFDFRRGGRPLNAQAETINSRTLAHETIHQLTYNSGLLDPKSDVPACINEGLGLYGEVWHPKGRGRIGQVNTAWLDFLRSREGSEGRLKVETLLTDDEAFEKPETRNHCYAGSWLLTHFAMKTKAVLPRFSNYLRSLRGRNEPKSRVAEFVRHLGSLDRLDADLRKYQQRPIGS